MRRTFWHNRCLGLGVFLTLLACGVAAPQARAGCDYPTVASATAHGISFDEPSNHVSKSLSHRSLPTPRPCTGPHCSRSPLVPSTPPAAPIVSDQEWACLGDSECDGRNPRAGRWIEADSRKPVFTSLIIYHPPR